MSLPPSDYFDASFASRPDSEFPRGQDICAQVGDQRQGACSEGAASPHGTGQQFRDRGQRNPRIEASAGLPGNAGYDKSAKYSIERPLHLSVERITYFTEPVLPWAAPPNDQGTAAEDRSVATQRTVQATLARRVKGYSEQSRTSGQVGSGPIPGKPYKCQP